MKMLFMVLALVISVTGYDDIPAEGMELTINEAHEDILKGDMRMDLEGSLLCTTPLTVSVTRSATGLNDEFCCAGQCKAGNGETTEILSYNPGGMAEWYIHYTPVPGSKETITYLFDDGTESCTLTVHFDYSAQGVEEVQRDDVQCTKVLRDGQVLIMNKGTTYNVQGTRYNVQGTK